VKGICGQAELFEGDGLVNVAWTVNVLTPEPDHELTMPWTVCE
jgi:hypothetical protein